MINDLRDLLDFQLIDIVSIQSTVPRSQFSEEEIEQLANIFLHSGGNLRPLILKRTSPEDFEVIEGDLELYAAQRAREINKYFEMVRAIIVNPKNQAGITEQLQFLDRDLPKFIDSSDLVDNEPASQKIFQLIANLEKHLDRKFENLQGQVQQNNQEIESLRNELKPKKENQSFLDKFNYYSLDELVNALDRQAGLARNQAFKLAELIIQTRQEQPFTSLQNLIDRVRKTPKRRAISEKRMVTLLDNWSRTLGS